MELVSDVTFPLDLSGVTLSDSTGIRHSFTPGTLLQPRKVVVVFGGGTPSCAMPLGVIVQAASTGSFSLSDAGETITLKNAAGTTIESVAYPVSNPDVSFSRSPDVTGAFVLHNAIPASGGSHHSPGRKADGSAF